MDRRDRMAMYGSDLKSLPEVEIDLDAMTATFYVEPDLPAAPLREKSELELRGEQLDESISKFIDEVIDRLVDSKKIEPKYMGSCYGWSIHFPERPEGYMDFLPESRRTWFQGTLREMLVDALRTKSFYNFFKGYLSVDLASRWQSQWDTERPKAPHTIVLSLQFGPRDWIQLDKDDSQNRTRPSIRLWFKKNGRKVFSLREIQQDNLPYYMTQGSGPRIPFHFGIGAMEWIIRDQEDEQGLNFFQKCKLRASKGWDMFSTGSISFGSLGRALNRMVHGETTKEQYEETLRSWLGLQDYDMEQWPNASMELVQKAREELGDWVLRFLEPGMVEHVLHLKWEVCGTCDGKGEHVNPSIDAHGITADEFSEDPDFAEEYFRGSYNVNCYECGGRTTSLVINRERTSEVALKAADEIINDHYDYIRESEAERRMGA